jgi:hypothetical protein
MSKHRGSRNPPVQNKPAFLQLSPDGSGIHGQIYRAAQGDSGKRAWFWHRQ